MAALPAYPPKQKGSGLGLAVTYSIIKKHGGHIAVSSKTGQGTTFDIYLPALEKEIFAVEGVEEEGLFLGRGKILFMDDQLIIRNMVRKMLNHLGYEVELAEDGAEAVELYKKARDSGRKFEAVILDLTVPGGMGGDRAIRKLLAIDPEIKAIVSSGYANDPIMSEYRSHGFSAVVAKPYEIKKLAEVLHRVILGQEEVCK